MLIKYVFYPDAINDWSTRQSLLPQRNIPDSKVHGANIAPTWVLPAPDGSHVGPMNLAIRDDLQ